MAKKLIKVIKLQIQAGKANPAPPIGPALGGAGVNIMAFCKQFNALTQNMTGEVPVVIEVFGDKTFNLTLKKPTVATMLKKLAGIEKGSAVPNRTKVAQVTEAQVLKIAEEKMEDLNARDVKAAANMVKGTARSMGCTVV